MYLKTFWKLKTLLFSRLTINSDNYMIPILIATLEILEFLIQKQLFKGHKHFKISVIVFLTSYCLKSMKVLCRISF